MLEVRELLCTVVVLGVPVDETVFISETAVETWGFATLIFAPDGDCTSVAIKL